MRGIRRSIVMAVLALLAQLCWTGYRALDQRHMWTWLPAYVTQPLRAESPPAAGPTHILLVCVDLFEPKFHHLGAEREHQRVARWTSEYPVLANAHRDAYGRAPQHTFFLPYDQFEPWTLQEVNELVFAGYGEVELALHHSGDTAETLRATLDAAKAAYARRGALVTAERQPQSRFGFLHGSWALDNSDPDHCGVDTELDVLSEAGCYADFTFPALHRPTQPRTINSIYYAVDTPGPKSYDTGVAAAVGRPAPKEGLLLIEGVLGINWGRLRHGAAPRLEVSGNLFAPNPPTPARADYWVQTGIHVRGRPEWVFLPVRAHGAEESQLATFFDGAFDGFLTYLEREYNDGTNYVLHYVTAREAYNIAKAAEAGRAGDPHAYRDFCIPPYVNSRINSSTPYTVHRADDTLELRFHAGAPTEVRLKGRAVRLLAGPMEAITLSPHAAEVRLTQRSAAFTLVSDRPVAAIEGASIERFEDRGVAWTYELRAAPESRIARWSYD